MKRPILAAGAVLFIVVAFSCQKEEINREPTSGAQPGQAGASSGVAGFSAAGAGGGVAGHGGQAGQGGSAGQGGAAGEAALTRCPDDLPGPRLVFIPHPKGAYCIDATEVTQSQYAYFVAKNTIATVKQPPECAKNTTISPRSDEADWAWTCRKGVYDPAVKGDFPVTCIDWCDAYAYCAWAGKHLCGLPGLEEGTMGKENVRTGQWGYACTQGGVSDHAYGQEEQPGRCHEHTAPPEILKPAGAQAECHGATAPFDQVFDLEGNADEWEGLCNGLDCRNRDGIVDDGASTSCNGWGTNQRSRVADTLGFRCCYD